MRALIRFGLRQTVLMNLLFVAVVAFAATWAIPSLPVDRYPNFSFGETTITVRWPGSSAADVERLVAKPLEDAIRGMDDLEFVKSVSQAGQAELQVKFLDDSDYATLYDELRLRVLSAQNRLPSSDGEPLNPVFAKVETDQWLPVVQVGIASSDPAKPLGRRQLTLLAKELQTRFELIDGVKRVELWGDEAQQFDIALDPARLEAHGLTAAQVHAAIASAGAAAPAGSVAGPEGDRLVRVDGRWRDPQQVLDAPVRVDGAGRVLRVGDLTDPAATGIRGPERGTRISLDGVEAVSCKVVKDAGADARAVRERVGEAVAAFHAARPGGGFRVVYALDSTVFIGDSIGVLGMNLVQGFCLVLLVLGFTLGFRASVLALSGMVFAFLGTLLWFRFTGSSINELSLLGFVIVVGILVDDAVVVLDNILRKRDEGMAIDEAVVEGTQEVFWPVIASVTTTMASFLPLFLMTGTVGQFFALVPTAVVAALVLSLFECMLMLPGHVRDFERWFGRGRSFSGEGLGHLQARGPLGWLARIYDRVFTWCLVRPWTTVALTIGLFLAAIGVLVQSAAAPYIGMRPLLKLEFFPSDATVAEIRVTMPSGTPLEETDAKVRAIAGWLAAKGPGEVSSAQGIAGLTIDTTYKPQWGSRYGIIQVEVAGRGARTFADPNAWIRELGPQVRERFAAGTEQLTVDAQQGGPPTGLPINVRVAGLDEAQVRTAAEALHAWMQSEARPGGRLHGAVDIASDLNRTETVMAVRLDRDALARLGLSEREAAQAAAGAVDGAYAGELRRSDDEVPIRVRLARGAVDEPERLAAAPIAWRGEPPAPVRLGDIARIAIDQEPAELVRRDFVRTVTITGRLADDSRINAFQATAEVRAWMDANRTAFPGAVVAFGGESESTGRTYASLGFAFAVTVLAIYTILAMQFRSYLQPLLVMSSIVFSLTGVILLMGAFGACVALLGPGIIRPERALFTVNSFIAVVALTGMVVNNAIILIDFINQRRAAGGALMPVLRESAHLRLRAVLLTTVTTIAGMLPTAIGIPDFSLTWSPMATAFVAGLLLSTVLTLLVVPVLYLLLERRREAALHRDGPAPS